MKTNNAVIYCRSARADEWAMKTQTDMVLRFAEDEGFTVSKCYLDNGEGGHTLDRPAMNKLLSDIRGGGVTTVIAKDASRIARNILLLNDFLDEMRKHGVTVITVYNDIAVIPALDDLLKSLAEKRNAVTV